MKKSDIAIKITSYVLFAFIILTGFIIKLNNKLSSYETNLQNSNLKYIDELSENINDMENTLTKSLYTNTLTQQVKTFTKLSRESSNAKEDLSAISSTNEQLDNLNLFISQVSDYALSLTEKVAKGKNLSSEDMNNLNTLLNYTKSLNADFSNIRSVYAEENFNYKKILNQYNEATNSDLPVDLLSVSDGFIDVEDDLSDYPKLIYDGPFSDNIMNKSSDFLKDKPNVSIEDAKNKAAKYLNVDINLVEFKGETQGNLPTYNFNVDNTNINITKQGGYVADVLVKHEVEDEKISSDQAVVLAKDFLKKLGINNMKESYFASSNGVCTVNFAYFENNITYYSDLMKVGIAQDTGQVVSFTASGYLMNHKKRTVENSVIDEERAKASLKDNLQVKSVGQAFIPTSSLNEAFCYEFKCTSEDSRDIIVYVNASTGMEEDVLILLKADNGTLVT